MDCIGFSDLTVVHSFINRQFGIASYSFKKMCNSFPDRLDKKAEPKAKLETIESIFIRHFVGKDAILPFRIIITATEMVAFEGKN